MFPQHNQLAVQEVRVFDISGAETDACLHCLCLCALDAPPVSTLLIKTASPF